MKKKIIIVAGDPNSINSELIFKGWKKFSPSIRNRIYLITNFDLIKKQFRNLKYSIPIKIVSDINENKSGNILKIINIDLKFKNPFAVPANVASKFILNSLNLAHELALRKDVSGIINCAINKNLLGKNKIGVTEYLASKCNLKDNSGVMLITNKKFSVSPVTTHLDVKQISRNIKKKSIVKTIKSFNNWYKKNHKKKPKIGILGLNPHNAELRRNSEEKKTIIPAILQLKGLGINIKGPLVADTIFINEFKKYDVIFGMFHDQILPPFKALFKFDAINVTLGLKYLRVSPDHGTGVNLIRKNKANIKSFINCINFINKFGK